MRLVRVRASLGVQQGSRVSRSGKHCDPILESARSRSSDDSPGRRGGSVQPAHRDVRATQRLFQRGREWRQCPQGGGAWSYV